MQGIAGSNLEVRKFDVVHDEPPDAPYDLVAIRALLHHLPERRAVVSKMARWLKPGGQLFVQEPDFYPTWAVEPPSQNHFWKQFIQWAATHQIDYYVGRKIPAWLQTEGLLNIKSEGHAILYNGGSGFAQWWDYGIREIADKLQSEGDVPSITRRVICALSRPDLLDNNYCIYGDNRTAPNPHLSEVRFGSLADLCDAGAMSALPPKADMCSALHHVRFVPIADIPLFIRPSRLHAPALSEAR